MSDHCKFHPFFSNFGEGSVITVTLCIHLLGLPKKWHNSRDLLCHRFGGQESEIKIPAGLVPC